MTSIRNKSILVVDDDPGMLRALEKVLTSEGALVTSAKWVGDAVDLLTQRERHIDLVVTDLRMPIVTGVTLVDAIHKIFPALPVIVLTAFSSPDVKALCLDQGAVAVLEKPLDSTQLVAAIVSALAVSKAIQQA
ncbi:MAG: response regulator [Chthoniobacter sp.]|uniref:response regulator n=1 Tax=Chthoniobacter sp. TaxID=2510640 RepID=UPI0032ABD36B